MLTPLAKFQDPFEKRENFAVSLRKLKKQERVFTKRRAFYGRQIRTENLTKNPEEEVVEG